YTHSSFFDGTKKELMNVLNEFHNQHPTSMGFPKKDILPKLKSERVLVDTALNNLLESGSIKSNETGLQIPERTPSLSSAQSVMADKILKTYKDSGFTTPRKDELPELVEAPANVITPILKFLEQTSQIVIISDKAMAMFMDFMGTALQPGAVDVVTKELIAVALSLAVHCVPCSKIHIKKSLKMGISKEELEEAAALAVGFAGCRAMMLWNQLKQELL
ncbi:carboxymuconolactone decarboxylase family protein, partial [Verrucomicrobiota bacterium]